MIVAEKNAATEALSEEAIFAFLSRTYVQQADARQRGMGLQYMTAETRDLAREFAGFVSGAQA